MENIRVGPCGFCVEDSQGYKNYFSMASFLWKDKEFASIISQNVSQEALYNFAEFYASQLKGRFIRTGTLGNLAEA